MRKFALITILAAAMSVATPALADDVQTAAAAAGGAAVGTVAAKMVNIGGNSVNCDAIPVKDLSTQDFQNIQNACATLNKAAPESDKPMLTPDDVKEWGSLAKEFGSAIGQTAKELGIAVNDFLRTPAGILITIYLFWSKLGGIIIGVPFVLCIWFAFFKVWNTFRRTPTAYEYKPVLFGLFNKKYITSYEYRDADETWWSGALGGLVTIGISAIVICTIIL